MSSLCHKNISRLDVSVHDALRVRCVKRLGDFDREKKKFIHSHGMIADQVCFQSCWLAGSAEMVNQHDGLFPLINLKEDDGLPVG